MGPFVRFISLSVQARSLGNGGRSLLDNTGWSWVVPKQRDEQKSKKQDANSDADPSDPPSHALDAMVKNQLSSR